MRLDRLSALFLYAGLAAGFSSQSAAAAITTPQPPLTTAPFKLDSGTLVLRCGTLIDGASALDDVQVLQNVAVVVKGGLPFKLPAS
jgi:hypothetical protein